MDNAAGYGYGEAGMTTQSNVKLLELDSTEKEPLFFATGARIASVFYGRVKRDPPSYGGRNRDIRLF